MRSGTLAAFTAPGGLEMAVPFHQTVPLLRIFHVQQARDFYVGFLGFRIDWEHRFDPTAPVYLQVLKRCEETSSLSVSLTTQIHPPGQPSTPATTPISEPGRRAAGPGP
jgi:hypothetical protein